jgi:hypothetical protein
LWQTKVRAIWYRSHFRYRMSSRGCHAVFQPFRPFRRSETTSFTNLSPSHDTAMRSDPLGLTRGRKTRHRGGFMARLFSGDGWCSVLSLPRPSPPPSVLAYTRLNRQPRASAGVPFPQLHPMLTARPCKLRARLRSPHNLCPRLGTGWFPKVAFHGFGVYHNPANVASAVSTRRSAYQPAPTPD